MGTEVLRPHICLAGHMSVAGPPAIFPGRTPSRARSVRKPATRKPVQTRRWVEVKDPLVAEFVILRRGESLPETTMRGLQSPKTPAPSVATDDLAIGRKIRAVDLYAGSAICNSPPPSDLPLPNFTRAKAATRIVDETLTRDLKRLLRLGG